MLVYTKIVDGEKKIYGTLENVPGENDTEVIYKDDEGNTITLAAKDVYIDNKKGGIIRLSDKKVVNVFIDTTKVIPVK